VRTGPTPPAPADSAGATTTVAPESGEFTGSFNVRGAASLRVPGCPVVSDCRAGYSAGMKTLPTLWLAFAVRFAIVAPAADPPFAGGHWLDLTHDFSAETIYWPTAQGFVLETEFAGKTPQGYFYAANRYRASEHGGTHIDAPIHFADGHKTVDQLGLEQLTGAAIVVDVSARALKDADYRISVADLKMWEAVHGQIPRDAILLLNTGFARHWPDANRYLGTDKKGAEAVAQLHFPGLHPDAARWLVTDRVIKAVGLDTASIDYGQSKLFESHRILFEKDVPAFENVAALNQLPPTGAYVIALPMKIKGGSGGPLRIIAWVPAK